MTAVLRDSFESMDLPLVLRQVEHWNYLVASKTSGGYDDLDHDYWLASSADGQTWFLAVTKCESGRIRYDDVQVALLHPRKPDPTTIGEILIRIYSASESNRDDDLTSASIAEVAASMAFPEYPPVTDLMPEAPEEWLDLPCELTVGFSLSGDGCDPPSLYAEFRRKSIEDALRVLCGARHDGILVHYILHAREVIPFLLWDVDWPLLRRGKDQPWERTRVQGVAPWEFEPDTTLMEIYQYIRYNNFEGIPPFWGEPNVRLRVGGRTRETAVKNWYTCASVLRKLRRAIIAESAAP